MRGKIVVWFAAAVGMLAVGCTTVGGSPATVPPTTAPTTSTSSSTSSTTTSPTTVATSTTADRLAEVQAIFEDLERRRLQALYEGDREAFAALFANDAYLQGSLSVFDSFELSEPPELELSIVEVVVDRSDCLAARLTESVNGSQPASATVVLQPRSDGDWGYSFIGTGWLCDGPYPLDS